MNEQSYVVTRNTRSCEAPPVAPISDDGLPFEFSMRFGGGWKICWTSDVECLAGVLCGNVDQYLAGDEHQRLVSRILASTKMQCRVQATINAEAQIDGTWKKLVESEIEVLVGRRDRQPSGWNADLFDGTDWWLAPVDLVVIATSYAPWSDTPLPMTSGERLRIVDPVTTEDWLETLSDLGVIDLAFRDA